VLPDPLQQLAGAEWVGGCIVHDVIDGDRRIPSDAARATVPNWRSCTIAGASGFTMLPRAMNADSAS
jgi:hypothetical protein